MDNQPKHGRQNSPMRANRQRHKPPWLVDAVAFSIGQLHSSKQKFRKQQTALHE
jgi:hypothetical protein